MAETEPIDLRILQALRTQLQGIKHSAGFYYTVPASAVRFDPDVTIEDLMAVDGPRPFMVIELTDDPHEVYQAPDELKVTLKVRIYWIHTVSQSDESRLQVYLRGCADIERAIGVLDRSLGGDATDVVIVDRNLGLAPITSEVCATVDVQIVFYRTFGNPLGV